MSEQNTTLECEVHGARVWRGTVMCNECGRVYQTHDEKHPRWAPITCKCGVRLGPATPAETEAGEVIEFSARAICTVDYKRIVTKFGGRIPNWKPQ